MSSAARPASQTASSPVTGSICGPPPAVLPPPCVDVGVGVGIAVGADVAGVELGVPDADEVDGVRAGGADVCAVECELMRTATEASATVSTTSRLKRMISIRGPAVRT